LLNRRHSLDLIEVRCGSLSPIGMTRFCCPASATHAAAAFREMRNVTFADDPELA